MENILKTLPEKYQRQQYIEFELKRVDSYTLNVILSLTQNIPEFTTESILASNPAVWQQACEDVRYCENSEVFVIPENKNLTAIEFPGPFQLSEETFVYEKRNTLRNLKWQSALIKSIVYTDVPVVPKCIEKTKLSPRFLIYEISECESTISQWVHLKLPGQNDVKEVGWLVGFTPDDKDWDEDETRVKKTLLSFWGIPKDLIGQPEVVPGAFRITPLTEKRGKREIPWCVNLYVEFYSSFFEENNDALGTVKGQQRRNTGNRKDKCVINLDMFLNKPEGSA